MIFRLLLLITLLVGLTCARSTNEQAQRQHNRPAAQQQHHNRPAAQQKHHQRPVHKKPTPVFLALDQVIRKKPTERFLGRHFVRKALASQQAGDKFLKLRGRETQGLNGRITINKKNIFVVQSANKDGHFVLTNKRNRVVGNVDAHGITHKHMTVHLLKNGNSVINGYGSGNSRLSLEQDIIQPRRGQKGKIQAPKKHIKMNVFQNHYTNGHLEITDIDDGQEQQQIRFRRQADTPVEAPCRELNCLNAVQY